MYVRTCTERVVGSLLASPTVKLSDILKKRRPSYCVLVLALLNDKPSRSQTIAELRAGHQSGPSEEAARGPTSIHPSGHGREEEENHGWRRAPSKATEYRDPEAGEEMSAQPHASLSPGWRRNTCYVKTCSSLGGTGVMWAAAREGFLPG